MLPPQKLQLKLALSAGGSISFQTRRSFSQTETWETPIWLLELLYPIVGGAFELDPCSPTQSPAWPRFAPNVIPGRLRFRGAEAVAPNDSALVLWGGTDMQRKAIHDAFPDAQWVPRNIPLQDG